MTDTAGQSDFRIDDLPEVAVLAAPVRDGQGCVLLKAGTLLTASLVDKLRDRGIQTLSIDVPDAATELPSDESALRERICERLQTLFRQTLKAGEFNPLLHLVQRYRVDLLP